MISSMIVMTHFFLKPQRADAEPYCIRNPKADFPSLEAAREVAFSNAEALVHSILIERVNKDGWPTNPPQSEQWIRNGDEWERRDAPRP